MSTPSTSLCGVQTGSRFFQVLINPRSRQILLQSLVSINLSYELVAGSDVMISRLTSDGLVVGLWLFIGLLALFPASVLEGRDDSTPVGAARRHRGFVERPRGPMVR